MPGLFRAQGFQLRLGSIDHCPAHRSCQGTSSSWSSCQHHLSHRRNGKGSADGRKWLWVRARLARITLLLPISWDGQRLPQEAQRTAPFFIVTTISITAVTVIIVTVLPCLWVRQCAGELTCISLFHPQKQPLEGGLTFLGLQIKKLRHKFSFIISEPGRGMKPPLKMLFLFFFFFLFPFLFFFKENMEC